METLFQAHKRSTHGQAASKRRFFGLGRVLPAPVKERVEDGLLALKYMQLSRQFKRAVAERRARYDGVDLGFSTPRIGNRDFSEAVEALDRDGYVVFEDAFSPDGLREVAQELEQAHARGCALPIFRGTRDHGLSRFLSPEEVARGEDYIRTQANLFYLGDPFVVCPSAHRYIFSDEVIDLAAASYGCPPSLVAGKLTKYYGNDLPLMDPFIFHIDSQAKHILKYFFYLNDVDEDGGPLCYVKGSTHKKPARFLSKYAWSDREIEDSYGKDAIKYLTGKVGTMIVANTGGFHKALKPRTRDRLALVLTTGVHRFPGTIRLSADTLEGLSPKQRAMADIAEII